MFVFLHETIFFFLHKYILHYIITLYTLYIHYIYICDAFLLVLFVYHALFIQSRMVS